MSNYKFKLLITPDCIRSKIDPLQRDSIEDIQIIGVILHDNGQLEIECLALKETPIELQYIQKLSDGCSIGLNI